MGCGRWCRGKIYHVPSCNKKVVALETLLNQCQYNVQLGINRYFSLSLSLSLSLCLYGYF